MHGSDWSELGRTLNFCKMLTRKRKISILARFSPRQFLGPMENGITLSDFTNLPFLSKCRSGSKRRGSGHKSGSLWTCQMFEIICHKSKFKAVTKRFSSCCWFEKTHICCRGVTRIDGARGKKQVCHPHVRT